MSGEPCGHGSGRPNVSQRPRDGSACRHTVASDLIEAFLKRLREVDVHARISTRVRNTFPFRGFAAATVLGSSIWAGTRENTFYDSSHRRATDVPIASRWPHCHSGRDASSDV